MARPQIIANGGSPGVKASVSASSAITLTLDSTVGVRNVQWIVLSTDETTTTGDYTLVQSGSVGQTATTTSLTAGTAVLFKVIVNSGLVRGLPNLDDTSNTIKVFVPTAEGMEVGCAGETYESDETTGTTGILNAPIRQLNTFTTSLYKNDLKRAKASATSNIALTGDPSPMDGQTIVTGDIVFLSAQTAPAENGLWEVSTTGAWSRADNFTTEAAIKGCVISVVLGTTRAGYFYQNTNTGSITVGTTALTFIRLPDKYDRADLGNASATPSAGILTKFGASAELLAAFFSSNGSNPAQVGILRGLYNSVLVAARDAANSADLHALSMVGTDIVQVGSSLVDGIRLSVQASALVDFLDNTVSFLQAAKAGLVFGRTATMSVTQAAASGGAGTNATIEAQAGDAGFDGATITIASGTAGSGANSGSIRLDTKASSTASGRFSVRGGGFGEFFGMYYTDASSTTTIEVGADTTIFDTKELQFPATNVAMFTTTGSYGGGTNVVYFPNASGAPSSNITSGIGLYASGNALRTRNHALVVLSPDIENAAGSDDLRAPDRRASRTTTSDATVTTAYTYAVPDDCVVFFDVNVVAFCPTDGTSSVYKIKAGVKRFGGGGATLIGAVDVFEREDNAALDATLDVSGNDARIRITGIGATTFDWLVTMEATLEQITS